VRLLRTTTQANSYEKALHYWYEAAKRSSARSAHKEAVGHLKQGLTQIPNIVDPMQRNKMELLLQTSLGNSLRTIQGWRGCMLAKSNSLGTA
jgi:hypothetical protein